MRDVCVSIKKLKKTIVCKVITNNISHVVAPNKKKGRMSEYLCTDEVCLNNFAILFINGSFVTLSYNRRLLIL